LNDADAALPALSFAEQETVVGPIGNVEPEAGVQVTATEPSTRSEAETVNFATAPLLLVVEMVMSAGTLMVGGVLSTTVTLNEADAALPALSFTEHVTCVEPNANAEPDEGAHVGVREPSTASNAETVNVTAAPFALVASAVMPPGTVKTGGVLS
jgi:anaerobic selenocysteine-containing dehydrogenase